MKPLQQEDFCATVSAVSDLADRVRLRLREEMTRKHLSQPEVADLIHWTQSRVAQKLTGRTPITLPELETLAFAVGLPITEVVRDHGVEFCAEMRPTEVRVLDQFRRCTPAQRDTVQRVIDAFAAPRAETRYARPKKPIIPKGRS